MKILITGANGFIGNHLLENISSKNTVYGLMGKKDLDFLDSAEVGKMFDKSFDLVIHCATNGRYRHTSTDDDILASNLRMFMNIHANRHKFKKLINIGSGAEFDLNKNIDRIKEQELRNRVPESSYGLSKNIISRLVLDTKNFYTLRLFGCISHEIPSGTLLSNFLLSVKNNQIFNLENDRKFDFFSADDLVKVVEFLIDNDPIEKDMNLVYGEKIKLSELLIKYCNLHGINKNLVNIFSTSHVDYTGNGDRIADLDIKFDGLNAILGSIK